MSSRPSADAVLGGVVAVVTLAVVLQLWVRYEQKALREPPREVEGCLVCHAGVAGIEPSHAAIGCAACHLGEPRASRAEAAHRGLVRIPGQAEDLPRTCGAAACHPQMPARLAASVMSTMNGVVSVDRWVFGEQPTPTARSPVQALGNSPADTHLRNLCASCHLTQVKREPGPVDETSRGGGCNACHLQYSPEAEKSLRADGGLAVHPQLRARPTDAHCFGCHSRSGRIALNYQGLWEASDGGTVRTLADGRRLGAMPADVHFEKGLACVDCHTSWEVMGDGREVLHREDQATLACADCHLTGPTRSLVFAAADPETQKVVRLRGGSARPERLFLTAQKSGLALASTVVLDGGAFLESPRGLQPLTSPSAACTAPAHRALSCGACHDAWAPQCLGCHTRFDDAGVRFDLLDQAERPGQWLETPGAQLAEPATLGVRALDGGRRVEEFVPGMVLTLDRGDGSPLFRRLFAPLAPHTIRRQARPCLACHASPVALGYGRGELTFDRASRRWRFSPARPLAADGLPEDAWVGFLAAPQPHRSTREDARAFDVEEQRRVLTVGACLGCHAGDSTVMREAQEDFAGTSRRRAPPCVVADGPR